MDTQTHLDFSLPEPPTDLSPPLQAVWWLRKGDLKLGPEWERAHTICQSAEGTSAYDWVHALCHLIEGDHGNADYWFRRAGRPVNQDIEALWREMASSAKL